MEAGEASGWRRAPARRSARSWGLGGEASAEGVGSHETRQSRTEFVDLGVSVKAGLLVQLFVQQV